MYTEESITAVKDVAEIVDVVESFVHLKRDGANLHACCPFHDEKSPSFKVSKAKQLFKCFGCGKSGDAISFLMLHEHHSYVQAIEWLATKYHISLETVDGGPKVYILPTWKNETTINPGVVKWFEGRGISQKTLIDMRITGGKEWMPQVQMEVGVMMFNYFRNDVLTNIKYRDSKKNFKLHKNSELIFYNLDAIRAFDECYIVEGEIDAVSLHEAGIKNVLSVPNGASKHENNLAYLDNCIDELGHIKKFHLAFDNDANGRKLREDIANRLGKGICDYIEFKDCKDANECLMRYNIQGIIESIGNKIEFPLEGVFSVMDYTNDIDDMYINGLDKGINLEIPNFDLNIVNGYLSIITGIPSHGKSDWVDYMALQLIKKGQTGAFYSPENKPTQLHFSKLARKLIGKHWDKKDKHGIKIFNPMTAEEKDLAKNYLNKKVWFIEPALNFSLSGILNQIRDLQIRYGLNFFVIDAWNKLEHKGKGDSDYIGRCLDEIAMFCKMHKLHCFLVAHPTKMDKDNKGDYEVATMYNISGSNNFYNKADNGISVYRNFKTNETYIYIQKIKFDHWGTESHSVYKYDIPSKRYYIEGCRDDSNWITREVNLTAITEDNNTLTENNDYDF